MTWVLLGGAIVLEVFATTALKLSDGFTRLGWAAAMAVAEARSNSTRASLLAATPASMDAVSTTRSLSVLSNSRKSVSSTPMRISRLPPWMSPAIRAILTPGCTCASRNSAAMGESGSMASMPAV